MNLVKYSTILVRITTSHLFFEAQDVALPVASHLAMSDAEIGLASISGGEVFIGLKGPKFLTL